MKDPYLLNIKQKVIISESCVKLLRVEIDNNLSFEKHIPLLVKKASNQLNAISRVREGNNTTYILCIVDATGPSRSSVASLATLSGSEITVLMQSSTDFTF